MGEFYAKIAWPNHFSFEKGHWDSNMPADFSAIKPRIKILIRRCADQKIKSMEDSVYFPSIAVRYEVLKFDHLFNQITTASFFLSNLEY